MKLQLFSRIRFAKVVSVAGFSFLLSACSVTAPVQELSNARQTLHAAHLVSAQHYAPVLLDKAENLLKAAETELSAGEYAQARAYALAARQQAIRARQKALSQQKD